MEEHSLKSRKRRVRRVFFFIVLGAFFLPFAYCSVVHVYGPYYGKVLDAESGAPLEGAAVLAIFYMTRLGLMGERSEFISASEAVTDRNGEYYLPPKLLINYKYLGWWDKNAYFKVFKAGYGCYPLHKDVKPIFAPNASLPSNIYITVELPILSTREKVKSVDCESFLDVPYEYSRKYSDLINEERKNLGIGTISPR